MISESFGRMLRRRRQDVGLSQRELADAVGLHFTYLSKIENDKLPPPSLRAIKRIAAAICVAPEDVASFAEPSKQYMARLDSLQEEIGELYQKKRELLILIARYHGYHSDASVKALLGYDDDEALKRYWEALAEGALISPEEKE